MSEACSLGSLGNESKSRTEMRALKSGRISATSRRLRAACVPARLRTALTNSSGSSTFSLRGETASVPGLRGRKSNSARAPMRAAAMPASVISNAMAGGASCKIDLSLSVIITPALRLNKRDLVDFPQGGDSQAHLFDRRFAQEGHAVFLGGTLDLRRGAPVQDHFADAVGEIEQFVNGGAAAVSGAAAFEAAGTFHEGHVAPFVGVESAFHEHGIGILDFALAVLADLAHQALGEDAVERGHKIVGLDAHVEEAPQHVQDVIGMHGGEHQVAGEGGIDGDLRGLLIADFADHDLVGIVTQNGAQAAREGEALLLIHRDLGNALDLIFDGVFDGDDLVFVVLDLAERGVERGGFAAPGGPGDQHHAVGLRDVAAELDQVAFAEAHHVEREFVELFAHGFLVQHAQYGVLAVDGGHDGDAEIDQAVLIAHAEAPVLRDALLGDIEFAHDLDARDDGGLPVLGDGRHGVVQHAIDAVLDGHFLIARFDVNIAGAAFQGVEDGGIHQLDDRRDVGIRGGQLVDGEGLIRIAVFGDDVEGEPLGDFLQHALRLLGLLEQFRNLREGGDFDAQLLVEQEGQFIDQVEIARIGEGDIERAVLRVQRHEIVAEHEIHGDGAEEIVIDARFPQIDILAAVARGNGPRLLGLRPGFRPFGSVRSRHCSQLNPYRIVSAREKIGRYIAINTNATKPPITIMIAGSISERLAAILVLTSSSKNSATLLSMAGSAPVDSPTSIMSIASGGKILDCLSEPESGWPSRTLLPAASTARWSSGVPSESAAVSMAWTSGMPPTSKVLKMRASWATWYFSQISPTRGRRSFTRSTFSLAESRRTHQRNRKTAPTSAPANNTMYFCDAVPMAIRYTVIVGSFACMLL